jgi:hypothetical protein
MLSDASYDYLRDATYAGLAGQRIPLPGNAITASFDQRAAVG